MNGKAEESRRTEWFNDDPFWETFAPIMFDDARWAETGAVADGITRLARLDLYRADGPSTARAAPPSCLDLCCGFGRIGLELARRGFSLTGVDITAPYLETAREDAAAESLPAEFIHEDVRSFKRPGAFDVAVNLYNSFGYFADPDDDKLLVKNAFDSLKPGGVFFIETLGKEIAVRDFVQSEWFRRAGYVVFTEYEALDSWAALKNTWRLVPETGGGITEKVFVHRLYAASELRALFLDAGFTRVELYGDWDERPYDHQAVKLIAAGRKA
jgi:SAM-dependent methyltransferase